MKTLDEVEVYFKSQGYVVRSYPGLEQEYQAISVFGRLSPVKNMEIFGAGSAVVIIYSTGNWILRTKHGNRFQDEPFDNLERLLIVAKKILGPPKEPPKES